MMAGKTAKTRIAACMSKCILVKDYSVVLDLGREKSTVKSAEVVGLGQNPETFRQVFVIRGAGAYRSLPF